MDSLFATLWTLSVLFDLILGERDISVQPTFAKVLRCGARMFICGKVLVNKEQLLICSKLVIVILSAI